MQNLIVGCALCAGIWRTIDRTFSLFLFSFRHFIHHYFFSSYRHRARRKIHPRLTDSVRRSILDQDGIFTLQDLRYSDASTGDHHSLNSTCTGTLGRKCGRGDAFDEEERSLGARQSGWKQTRFFWLTSVPQESSQAPSVPSNVPSMEPTLSAPPTVSASPTTNPSVSAIPSSEPSDSLAPSSVPSSSRR